MSQAVSAGLKRSDSLLESFFIGLTNTHDFAYGSHLGAELIFYAFELLKRPSCKLDNDIIAVRFVFIQSTVLTAGDVLKCQTACQV